MVDSFVALDPYVKPGFVLLAWSFFDGAESPRTLIFDCETSTDAVQQLRLGFFQIRRGDKLHREGIFFNASALTASFQSPVR